MFKLLLISIVIGPVLLGVQAAKGRSTRQAFFRLLALVILYDTLYFAMLYYLRVRWVGW
jgi:uncharacterized membrane protein SirB2